MDPRAPRARQAKSKARMTSYESLLAQDPGSAEQELQIYIPPAPARGTWSSKPRR